MRRPWYTYLLLFIGCLALLGALFQPRVGGAATPPGAVVSGPQRVVILVRPGSPLARAGLRPGDRFVHGESVQVARGSGEIRWTLDIPRSGNVEILREGRRQWLEVRPAQMGMFRVLLPRFGWWIAGVLNVALVALALALFWQRPTEGPAVLLGLVLLSAPVFAFPREPRLLALVLAAHFFAVFPRPWPRRPWLRAGILYTPFILFGLVGTGLWGEGKVRQATIVFNLLAVGYAAYGVWKVRLRWREADEAERPVIRTLAMAAGAILAAVLVGVLQPLWVISGQFVPANLIPAVLFSAAVAHLVFRLRVLEVQVMARRTLQYLLARWTLGTLFLIPGFLLVWRFGQLSVTQERGRPGDVLPLLVWMFLTAMLLGKRHTVLRNLDRRFFRDIDAAREALIRLAHDLGEQTEPEAVVRTLESGVLHALGPAFVRLSPPDAPQSPDAALSLPVRRGAALLGVLKLGPKADGQPYSGEERRLLEAACAQAAVTLENARLSAALLARQRAELGARTAGVLAGAEEERRRLAADLHDQVLPELRQIAGEVERLKQNANGLTPELERLEWDVRGTMDSVREVMEALRPSALDMLGLGDALESYLRKSGARQNPPLSVTVRRVDEEPDLTPEQSLALYRICQEAINNVVKHAGAARAGLEMTVAGGVLTLAVWDDGCGLDLAAAGQGHGLANIRYRADLISAAVQWSRPAEGGTRLEVALPLAPALPPSPESSHPPSASDTALL